MQCGRCKGCSTPSSPKDPTGRSRPASHCSEVWRRQTLDLGKVGPHETVQARRGETASRSPRPLRATGRRTLGVVPSVGGPGCWEQTERPQHGSKHSKKFPRYAAEVSRGSARTFSRASRFPVRALLELWVWPCQPMTTGRCLLRAHHLGTGLMRLARSRNTSI